MNSGQAQVAADGVHSTPDGYRARAAAIAQALTGCSPQQSASGSHTITPAKKRHRAAAPKRRATPKPAPAVKPKAIKVYTPQTAAATTPATQAASPSSGGGTSPWLYVLLGGGLIVVLGLAWRWRRFLRTMRGPRWPT